MGKKQVKMTGTMKLKMAVYTSVIENRVFRWHVTKYTLLETGRLYFRAYSISGFKFSYMLIKARRTLHFAFRCEYTGALGMFLLSNGGPMSKLVRALEISEGLYVGQFPESLIMHGQGNYLKHGYFVVSFRLLASHSTIPVFHDGLDAIGTLVDLDDLCHEVQTAYINSFDRDFVIKAGGLELRTHKCVLYARSKFFERYFEKYPDASLFVMPRTCPGVVHEVLMYVYSGELSNLRADGVLRVLEVAYLLKIPMLKERCLSFFEGTGTWGVVEGVEFFEYDIVD